MTCFASWKISTWTWGRVQWGVYRKWSSWHRLHQALDQSLLAPYFLYSYIQIQLVTCVIRDTYSSWHILFVTWTPSGPSLKSAHPLFPIIILSWWNIVRDKCSSRHSLRRALHQSLRAPYFWCSFFVSYVHPLWYIWFVTSTPSGPSWKFTQILSVYSYIVIDISSVYMQFVTSTPSALHSSPRTSYFPCSYSVHDLCSSRHMQFLTLTPSGPALKRTHPLFSIFLLC